MSRVPGTLLWLASCLLLAGCGGDEGGGAPRWQHARIEGLAGVTGVAVVGADLVFVSGGNDRALRTVPRARLRDGGSLRARTFSVMIRPDAPIHGASALAFESYTLADLWKVPVDFQGVAFQPPDWLYVAERHRRLLFWGRVRRDAAGALASVKFAHVTVVPGADRSKVDRGDWRDHGPGLRGLAGVTAAGRQEDLWVVDEGAAGAPLYVRRMDRFSTDLRGLRVGLDGTEGPDARAVSVHGGQVHVLHGAGVGRIMRLPLPAKAAAPLDAAGPLAGTPAPAFAGVSAWSGMAHADDGTVFLVSGGDPAIVAWRARD